MVENVTESEPGGIKERLLQAARALFAEHGYAASSTRELAAHAGCNVAMIQHYFGSKQGLLRELLATQMRRHLGEVHQLVREVGSIEERIGRFVDLMIDHIAANRDFVRIVHRELQAGNSEFLREFQPAVAANMGLFAALLGQASDEGRLRDLDPRIAAMMLIAMIQFYFIAFPMASTLLGEPTPALIAELKRHARTIFLHGVLKGPQ